MLGSSRDPILRVVCLGSFSKGAVEPAIYTAWQRGGCLKSADIQLQAS